MAYSSSGPIALGTGATSSDYDTEWSPDLDADDLRELQEAQNDPSKTIFDLPRESARLGFFSTLCLIFNHMIGKYAVGEVLDPALMVPSRERESSTRAQ